MNFYIEDSIFRAIYDKSDEEVYNVWSKEESVTDIVLGLEPNHQLGWADVDYVYTCD